MSIKDKKITDAAVAAAGVQSRPDKLTGTAAQNKKVFDNLVTAVVKTALNGLIDELASSNAAAQLGIKTIPGFSAANIQTALEEIVAAMQNITQGAVPNKSITLAKLAAEVTAAALGGAAKTHTHGAADVSSGVLNIARIPALTAAKLPDGIITEGKLGAASVTAAKLAALAVQSTHIAKGAVTGQKIADGAVTGQKIADGAVGTAALGSGVVTRDKIAASAVGTSQIGNNAVTIATLADSVWYGQEHVWQTASTELWSSWNRMLVFAGAENIFFRISKERSDVIKMGYQVRLAAFSKPTRLRIDAIDGMWFISTGERKVYQNPSDVIYIDIPVGRYMDLLKVSEQTWMLTGNYADPVISGGTAAPSGGNNGDIYIQYSAASSANAVSKADVIGAADAVNEAEPPASEADAVIETPEAM